MLLAVAATKEWKIKSGDVKNAYLQGEMIDREVYMEPPLEMKKNGVIWKLKKSVYGMNDVGRRWFFKVEESMVKLGCEKSKFNHCLFVYREQGRMAGIILPRRWIQLAKPSREPSNCIFTLSPNYYYDVSSHLLPNTNI